MKKKKIHHRSDCAISIALDLIGDKWSLLIIRDMILRGKNTYGDFHKAGEKIATNILADRLALLEAGRIIEKGVHPKSKAMALYKLTSKGIDLVPVLIEMIDWSEHYNKVSPAYVKLSKQIIKDKQGVIKSIKENLKQPEPQCFLPI